MLQNETYIGNMVQGRSVKISYKSKKCLKQPGKLGGGGRARTSRWWTRKPSARCSGCSTAAGAPAAGPTTFSLKGLIFCHECGYPLAVIDNSSDSICSVKSGRSAVQYFNTFDFGNIDSSIGVISIQAFAIFQKNEIIIRQSIQSHVLQWC